MKLQNIGPLCFALAVLLAGSWVRAEEYTYDNLNRLSSVVYAPGVQITYSYDQSGNLTSISKLSSPISAPGAPTLNNIVSGLNSATIYFSAPANDGGSPISSYTAICEADGYETRTASGPGSPLIVTNLTTGIAYQCSVTATNEGGQTSSSSSSKTVTPGLESHTFPWNIFLPAILNGQK